MRATTVRDRIPFRFFRAACRVALTTGIAWGLWNPSPASGQAVLGPVRVISTAEPADPAEIEFPPGVQLPPGVGLPKAPGSRTNNAAGQEDKRLQELLKLQFDRRPQALLQALSKQADTQSAPTNDVQRFQADVVVGNWTAVKEFLAKLPEKQGPQVYKHVLEALDKNPSNSGSENSGMPAVPEMPQQSGNRGAPAPFLLPDDVIALSDAAPGELTDEQVELLGKLLGRALSRGNFIDPLLARLEAGTGRLGGQDPRKRELAVKMLLGANRLTDAGKFLPPLEPALATNDFKAIDLHARYLAAVGKQKQETNAAASLRGAWDLSQTILLATNVPSKEREQALSRALELMPLLAREQGTNWLRETFAKKPDQGMAILAAVGSQVVQQSSSRDLEARKRGMELQRRAVDSLLAVASETRSWAPALNVLTLGWMSEADYTKGRPTRRNAGFPQFDPYGNQMFVDGYPAGYQDPNQLPPVPAEDLLAAAPTETWLVLIDRSLAPRVRVLMGDLYVKAEQEEKALPYLEAVAAEQPKAALALANDLLRAWARSHDPNPPQQNNRFGPYGQVWYGPGSPYGMNPTGTPLTRAMQVRNLAELARLLERLRRLPIASLDEKAVVGAFSAAHSQAEVFRVEDIQAVFGPVTGIKPETLAEILQTMRQRLAGQWRAPRVQQDAKTKRNDKEIEAEVMRGYQLVVKLIESGLSQKPDDWRMNLVNGAALYDWAEFDYGRKVDLAIYVEKRDRAFRSFEKAAALYAGLARSLEEKEQTPQVFQQWFNATLGASDLAYLTRQTEPNTNQLDKIHAALFSLPGEVVERHVAAFGKGLSDSINTLKPELKPRYTRAGVRVVGDHESAVEVRKMARYYDDLLQEIALDVRVDGDPTVGHTKPFGVFIALRHTEALGRESGGFTKYLQNQQSMNYFYNPYGTPPVNYREDFQKQVKEKFAEGFDILAVTFHDDKVQARGYGRPSWRETPYAYLLLKAKDGAVDHLPSLQLDLDFFDRRGQVVLPVVSQTQLIDARPAEPPARPAAKVEVLQILDERELGKGTVSLEVKATARGLLPELKDLLDVNAPGMKVAKVDDRGLAITRMDAEGDEVAPVSERDWMITLSVEPGGAAPATFDFPKARPTGVEMTYKRYADADLVEVKPAVALAGLALQPRSPWKWVVAGAVVLCAVGAWVWWLRRQGAAELQVAAPAYVAPGQLTPFTVINLLQRMHADSKLALSGDQRRELADAIIALQARFFDRPASAKNGEPDLEQVTRRWLSCVR